MITGTPNDLVLFLMGADREQLYDLTEHKEKRSINQNSYYWALLGKVAQKTRVSSAEIHNRNLRDLGLVLRIDGGVVPVYLPDNDESEQIALKAETYHLKPTSETNEGKCGKLFRCYVMLRGSSSFNTEEMTALLDLMIQEAQAVGVETLTPAELARMRLESAQKDKSGKHNASGKASGRGTG